MAVEITSENFDTLLSEKEVLVAYFGAPWCGPCRMLGPIFKTVKEDNNDETVGIIKLDVDVDSDLATKYNVRGIPTLIYFKDGEVVDRTVGVQSKVSIEGKISELK
jgi:thioredoxin 1